MRTTLLFATVLSSTRPVAHLRVEAWDAEGDCPDLIEVAFTDARGRFEMRLDGEYFAEMLPRRKPSLSFRVFDGTRLLGLARRVVWQVAGQNSKLQIPLAAAEPATPPQLGPAPLVVRGVVREADGDPAAGLVVRAFDRNLGKSGFVDAEIGNARTNEDGEYEIRYALAAGAGGKPDLIVRVEGAPVAVVRPLVVVAAAARPAPAPAAPPPAILAESPLLRNPPATARVNLGLGAVAAPRRAEYRQVVNRLGPVLKKGGLEIADLSGESLEFAAEAAKLEPERVRLARHAAVLERKAAGAVPAEVFYALCRMGHEGGLAALASVPLAVHRTRLEDAIERSIVSASLEARLDEILAALQRVMVETALPAPRAGAKEGRLSRLLATSLADRNVQTAFLARWLARPGHGRDFWVTLRADPAFARGAADDLELTLQLADVFDEHMPALTEMRKLRQEGKVRSLRDLAGWDDADWKAFLTRAGGPPKSAPGATPDARAKAFIDGIQDELEDLHPTEPLRKRARAARPAIGVRWVPALLAANPGLDPKRPLPDEPRWGKIPAAEQAAARAEWAAFRREALTFRQVPSRALLEAIQKASGKNPVREAVNRILAGATELDLATENVEGQIAKAPKVLEGVEEPLRAGAIDHLKAAQRVLRITRRPRAVETLLGDGLDSAFRIVRVPAARFVRRYDTILGGEARAKRAYARAYRTAAAAQLALTTTAQAVDGASPWAVRGGPARAAQSRKHGQVLELLKGKARGKDAPAGSASSWPELFGEQAWCACEHCQSVYGPAAYLVDLLHMLDDGHDDRDPAHFLFKRRPDLEYLKLSCENTNTTIPAIDLINEVLETTIAANHGKLDREFSFDTGNVSAAELRAVPQNVRDDVYELLERQVYPFALPFSRSLEATRTYLDQLGTSYRDVLEVFGPDGGANDLTAEERVAAESLGLTALDFRIIAEISPGATVAQGYGFGPQDTQWEAALAEVPELLARTDVNYETLVEVVKTDFVNPLQHDAAKRLELDPPKNGKLAGTRLRKATAATWSRLHRFVRLKRRTGWSVADLDRAIFALASKKDDPVLDRETLRRLALVKRTVARLDRPLAAVLSLWSDIDTWGADALYLKLFQSPTVVRGDDARAFALKYADAEQPDLKPASGQHELTGAKKLLASQVPAVLAALRIAEPDLDRIWDHAIAKGTLPDRSKATLDLHSLSVLHRYTVLAKGLGMRIADLVALLALSGRDPFDPGHPRPTLAFIALARKVQASGFSVATLDYLYRHATAPAQGPAPADGEVLQALMKIWAALRTVRQDTEVADDPDGALLGARLAVVHPPEVVASILDALDPAKGLDRAARARVFADHLGEVLAGDATALLAPPEPVSDEQKAQRRLANQALVLARLSRWLRDSLSRQAVTAVVAGTLGLPDALARRLLVEWIPGALDSFLALAGGGLGVQYFAKPDLKGTATTATSSAIEMHVTATGPATSARWSGKLLPLGDGPHQLVVRTDGVARLRVNGEKFAWDKIERDAAKRPIVVDRTATVTLTAGTLAPVEVEFSAGSAGGIELLWKLASAPAATPVAPEHLFPAEGFAALDALGQGPGHVWRRLHKAALLIRGLGLGEPDLEYAESDGGRFGGFHLRDLTTAAASDPAHLARWERLAEYVAFRDSLPQAETALVDVLRGRSPGPDARVTYWRDRLCDATGWNPAAVESILDPAALTPEQWSALPGDAILARLLTRVAGPVPADGDLEIGRRLAAAQRCLDLVRRVGVTPRLLASWAKSEPGSGTAREVVQAVRARYDDEAAWLEVARARNDKLRDAQRDALVSHLLTHMRVAGQPLRGASDLFEHFLIDVKTSPAALTSRIKQAISSVQLFCQRILLGLEEKVDSDAIDAEHWPWMKSYRVWEANRKIFLYPENWIEPELRDGKSPFFEDLESELRQSELEDAHVEQALSTYLEKLDQVARLEVCAMHWQREDDEDDDDNDVDILHVVARTPGAPAVYFYRRLIDGTEWTPWTKIEIDIESEGGAGDVHMVLTTFNRRLYLFWGLFTEKPEAEQPGATEGESPSPPLTHWEIRLAWATCRDGKWSPKQVSTEGIRSNRFLDGSDRKDAKRNRDAVREVEKELDGLERARNQVGRPVRSREAKVWADLQQLRAQLHGAIERYVLFMLAIERDDEEFDVAVFNNRLAKLFSNEPGDLPQLEDWIEGKGKSFDQFLDDIFEWPRNNPNFLEQLAGQFPLSEELGNAIRRSYATLLDERQVLEDAQAAYGELKGAVDAFEAGTTPLAIPSVRRRRDHTFWLSRRDGFGVTVLRHASSGAVERLGRFTLSGDGRSLDAERLDRTLVTNFEDFAPAHSEPRFNGFRVRTARNRGLDLPGLSNLVRKAKDAVLVPEHDVGKELGGDDPPPFFLSKGRDCHVALPVPDPEPEKGAKPKRAQDKRLPATRKGKRRRPGNATYRFEPFGHPFVLSLIKRLNRDGVAGLLTFRAQSPKGADDGGKRGRFDDVFDPHPREVDTPYPPHDVDFRPQGAYSLYNWELFFHAPFLIAIRLMQDQRFEEARAWFHYIFDPTTEAGAEDPRRFWKLKPFRENDDTASATALLTALADPDAPAALKDRIEAQIDQWKRHPANPHRIAGLRLSAYQKSVVFRYIENLIAWGDSLFARDTIETLNEATQLYVLAGHLLGPRPERIPQIAETKPLDYASLRDRLDDMSNVLVEVENLVFPFAGARRGRGPDRREMAPMLGISHLPALKAAARGTGNGDRDGLQALSFCVPANDKLLGFWDTVEDRLFKIRHGLNIEGVERQLALFEPPIDPALLVRAAAAGLDLGSVLSDLAAPRGHHRFPLLLQKALDLCGDVKSLGAQLLSALEKRDAESLTLLRATHEKALLKAVRDVRSRQLAEAEAAKVALEKSREVVKARHEYYSSRKEINSGEAAQLDGMQAAVMMQQIGSMLTMQASALGSIPEFNIGPTGMGAHATSRFGGTAVANAMGYLGESLGHAAQATQSGASMSGILGGYERRQEDWDHQANLAAKELVQFDKQLAASDIRIAVAKLELRNHEIQIANADKVEEVLRTKYTNEQLYSWMISRISDVHYQAYKLAYDLAKRAERGYRFETGLKTSSFVQFGHWDSLRKGLLAGERLALDLKRMDAAYVDASRRDYEISRQVSLVLHDPQAFVALRETGRCEVTLPEELYDADYPGHYFRRLKSVSVTLPCVAGPYTPINCTLTLLSSRVRTNPTAASPYAEQDAPNDSRFAHDFGAIQSVATSHGQNDAGMFEVNFRDERYLPFEGSGAVSRWRIDLPKDCNAFDFDTLSDVVLRVSYTARDGGKPLAEAAGKSLKTRRAEGPGEGADGATPTTALRRLFRVRYEFSDAWTAFRNALAGGSGALALAIDKERFPYVFRGGKISIVGLHAFLSVTGATQRAALTVAAPQETKPAALAFEPSTDATLLRSTSAWSGDAIPGATAWTIAAKAADFPVERVKDLLLLATYTVKSESTVPGR